MNVDLRIPSNYSEMTEKQVRYVAALKMHGFTEKDIWRKCFIKFAGIIPIISFRDSYVFKKKGIKGFFSLKIEELSYFIKKMKWVTRDYRGICPPKVYGLKTCDEILQDTKFIQYIDAENYYEAFIYTEDQQILTMLMATLYQQATKYSKKNTTKIAAKIKRKNTAQFITLMWMLGIKQEFEKKWPYLFPKSNKQNNIDDDNDFEIVVPDMERIIRNQLRMLTKGDVTKETEVLNSLTHSALDELNTQCMEYEKFKSQKPNS